MELSFNDFKKRLQSELSLDMEFDNPGGGTSTIVSLSDNKIYYLRGNSRMGVSYKDLFDAYLNFAGKRTTTGDLRAFRPEVFDSQARPAGHSCNCTLLFSLLQYLKLASDFRGKGRVGNPFSVQISE